MELIVPLCIVGGVVVIGLLWFVVVYNRFVSIRQHLKESWADVDVELKRRYELIPNLVRTVKGYASHERDVFDAITKARAAAIANTGDPARQSGDEQRLVGQLGNLFVVAEAYPDLKADQNFLDLQLELFRDGRIRITWLNTPVFSNQYAIIGLGGEDVENQQMDFNNADVCGDNTTPGGSVALSPCFEEPDQINDIDASIRIDILSA